MMGQNAHDASHILVNFFNLPITPEEFVRLGNLGHERLFPLCPLLPGVAELVKHLKACNIPIAIATSSHKAAFLLKIQNHKDFFDLFEGCIVCGDDPRVLKGKPNPDIFLEAGKLIDALPCTTLVFEDSPSGMMAGIAAKMHVIAIPDRELVLQEDVKGQVAQLMYSMADFKPESVGLPPFLI